MTITHAYMAGTPETPGHIYYEQQGAWLRCELEPEDVIAALDAHMDESETVAVLAEQVVSLRDELYGDEHESGWSAWLNWAGGECPLPPDTGVECETANGDKTPEGRCVEARWWEWERRDSGSDIARFRYREDAPGGWVERGDFIPPESLFDEASPVRCEWTHGVPTTCPGTSNLGNDWRGITHIRLLPRSKPEPVEMPEGFHTSVDGYLRMSNGLWAFGPKELRYYGPTKIRAAVEAWLKEMERR